MPEGTDTAVIAIAGQADVRTIEAAHKDVLQALQQENAVELNLDGSSGIDLTLVQLVEAARRFAAAEGKTLTLSSPADGTLCEILQRGGFLGAAADRDFWLHDKGGN
jgi:hypothetical protein